MKRPVKIIIVGGNAAGTAAAAKAKRFNPSAEVLLFEASEFISTGTCEMPYVLSGDIDDYRKIVFFSPASFQIKKGAKVFIKHFVDEIDVKKKIITVKNLIEEKTIEHEYDKLILATGSKVKSLLGFVSQLKNVFTLKNISDLIGLNDNIKKEKPNRAVILGSGYIGLEAAEALIKRNIQVKIIERENYPFPTADKQFSDEILNILTENKIEFIGDVRHIEPMIIEDRVIGIKLAQKFIETDLVLMAVGFEPDNFLAQLSKLELGKSGAIKVDKYLRTSNSSVYAAGDNVEFINAVTGKPDYIPLATHAYEMGHIAGENTAGGNVQYEPIVNNISVKIFDKYIASIGLSSVEAEKNGFVVEESFAMAKNLVTVMPGSENVIGKVLMDKASKRIIGASFLGGKEVSGYADLVSALIKLRIPASFLAKINYNYTPPLSPFINLLNIIGKKFK